MSIAARSAAHRAERIRKSTFSSCASGLTKPQAGTVKLDGQDHHGMALNRIAREGRMLRSSRDVVSAPSILRKIWVIAGQMFTFPGLCHFSASDHGAGAGSRRCRERAREFIKDRRPLECAAPSRRKTVGRPAEADPVRIHAMPEQN